MDTNQSLRDQLHQLQQEEEELREKLQGSPLLDSMLGLIAERRRTLSARLQGDGVIVQGNDNVAGGAGSLNIKGDVGRDVHQHNYFNGGPNDPSPAGLRRAWLNRILERSDVLSLSGIDPGMAGRQGGREHLSLNAVYTALLTLTADEAGSRQDPNPERNRRLSALAALDRYPRLVLQGDPGSGKSTFVNFVALCLAGEALGNPEANLARLTAPLPDDDGDPGKEPQPWRHGALLPVPVVLRDFAAKGLPPVGQPAGARHLWGFIEQELTGAALGAFVPQLKQELLDDGGLILLDGLDEVPEAEQRREQVKQAVEGFAQTHRKCRFLVTCRTYAWQNQGWRLARFDEAILAPLSHGQIRLFIRRWYDHAAALGRFPPDDAAGRAERLRRAIFDRERLLGLAQRPLLLTLMASLHAWRGGTLPDERERLYADTVELLLDFWERQRVKEGDDHLQHSIAEWLRTDQKQVRRVLEGLAFEAHARQPDLQGTADIAEAALVAALMQHCPDPDTRHRRLVEYLRDRAGLLLPRGVGVYTFPHRSFQEYLAACHLTNDDFPARIAELAREAPERWREVALLAGAKAARGAGAILWQFVDELCPTEGDAPDLGAPDSWGAQIAGQMLAESADLTRISPANRRKLARVQSWLVRLLGDPALPATERAIAGASLAEIGDPRFDPDGWFLPKGPTLGFIEVPAGRFRMGEGDEEHEVALPGFYIARWPVTVGQFRAFVDGGGYPLARQEAIEGGGNLPVAYVSWHDALAYAGWLNDRMKAIAPNRAASATDEPTRAFWAALAEGRMRVTLPSEAEWERAARGTEGRRFPWGNGEPTAERANFGATGIGERSAVGCFPSGRGPCEAEEMAGNVWEWTRSRYGAYPYPDVGEKRLAREDLVDRQGDSRVLRGGAFDDLPYSLRCAFRNLYHPEFRDYYVGFRVVVSPFSDLCPLCPLTL